MKENVKNISGQLCETIVRIFDAELPGCLRVHQACCLMCL